MGLGLRLVHTSNLPLPLKTVTVSTHNLVHVEHIMAHITGHTTHILVSPGSSQMTGVPPEGHDLGDLMGRFCTCCSVREEMLPTVVMLRARTSCTRPWVLWRVWRCEDSVRVEVGGTMQCVK